MNRKYYFNNMWWGWVTGGYMLYMSWDYEFKYRLLFWCISLCGMVLYPVAKWYIEDTALKFTRPDFWNSGFFADTPGKNGIACGLYGYCFHIISSVKYDIYSFCYYKKAVCKIDSLSYILFKYPRTYSLFPQAIHQSAHR